MSLLSSGIAIYSWYWQAEVYDHARRCMAQRFAYSKCAQPATRSTLRAKLCGKIRLQNEKLGLTSKLVSAGNFPTRSSVSWFFSRKLEGAARGKLWPVSSFSRIHTCVRNCVLMEAFKLIQSKILSVLVDVDHFNGPPSRRWQEKVVDYPPYIFVIRMDMMPIWKVRKIFQFDTYRSLGLAICSWVPAAFL